MERRTLLSLGAGLLTLPRLATAAEPGRTDEQMKSDWPWLGRYADDNAALHTNGSKVDIVFIGDSITEGWKARSPDFFRQGWIDRGISGQTSPQMVLRMASDVVALRPKLVHIMAGTNDVAGNTGPMTSEMTVANIRAMTTLARDAGIKVVIGAIPPTTAFSWSPTVAPLAGILERNRLLHDHAVTQHLGWIDYYAALKDEKGGMDSRYAVDGVHPNKAGYAVMEATALPVIAAMLGGRRHK